MRRKINFLAAAIVLMGFTAKAQLQGIKLELAEANIPVKASQLSGEGFQGKAAMAGVNDTLDYFYNKNFYRSNSTTAGNSNFWTIKSAYSSTAVTHCGSLFYNSANITVNGLRGLVMKHPSSPSASVTVKLYLCSVNSMSLPVFPPLDSVTTQVSSSTGVFAGGSFTAPVNVSGNFAVLIKNGSAVPGDTVRLFLTNALTAASTATVAYRYGEGLGVLRYNGNFQSNTGAFGTATDYEFVVAPYVSFNINAGAIAVTPTICNFSTGQFSNTSTPMSLLENRQFNFNKFAAYWKPFNFSPGITDSIHNWTFTGSLTPPSTSKNPAAVFNALGNQTAALTIKYYESANLGWLKVSDGTTATININNSAAPSISVSGTTSFCASSGITTTLTAMGNPSFTWTAPLNTVTSVVVITQSVATAVYTVMANSGGCTAVLGVTVSIKPIPSLTLTTSKSTVCIGGSSINLTGTPAGGIYSGAHVTGNIFTSPSTTGTFTAVYAYTNAATSCSNTTSAVIRVDKCSGLTQNTLNENIQVYPNPTFGANISLKNLDGTNSIEVYSVLGILMSKQISFLPEAKIDLSYYANGNYFIKIVDANGASKTLKIVNQN